MCFWKKAFRITPPTFGVISVPLALRNTRNQSIGQPTVCKQRPNDFRYKPFSNRQEKCAKKTKIASRDELSLHLLLPSDYRRSTRNTKLLCLQTISRLRKRDSAEIAFLDYAIHQRSLQVSVSLTKRLTKLLDTQAHTSSIKHDRRNIISRPSNDTNGVAVQTETVRIR